MNFRNHRPCPFQHRHRLLTPPRLQSHTSGWMMPSFRPRGRPRLLPSICRATPPQRGVLAICTELWYFCSCASGQECDAIIAQSGGQKPSATRSVMPFASHWGVESCLLSNASRSRVNWCGPKLLESASAACCCCWYHIRSADVGCAASTHTC